VKKTKSNKNTGELKVLNFNIKVLSPITAKVLIIIYDIQGKEIKRQFVKPAEINNLGSDLKSGVYFIRFMQNGISKIRKIIKL
jgi:hypothetical protein